MEVGQGPNWGCSAKGKKKSSPITVCISTIYNEHNLENYSLDAYHEYWRDTKVGNSFTWNTKALIAVSRAQRCQLQGITSHNPHMNIRFFYVISVTPFQISTINLVICYIRLGTTNFPAFSRYTRILPFPHIIK
jgi:hypothetical protein